MQKNKNSRIILFFVFLFVAGGLWYWQTREPLFELLPNGDQTSPKNTPSNPETEVLSTQPFYDLTIPGLRSRSYESTLGERTILNTNSNYSSFLTNYDSDGLIINALLTIPSGEPPENGWPAVVFVHGYIPPSLYKTTEKYEDYVDFLARNGLVVLKIDLRGHGDSEGEPGGAYFSSDYIIDTLNAHAALVSTDFVDASKVGLWGHSMAGNVVFRSMVVQKDIPAVVIWAGAVYTYEDMAEFGIQDNSYRPPSDNSVNRQRRNKIFETYDRSDLSIPFWQAVIPINYLDGVTSALQVHHAVDDEVVNIEYSRNLMKVLENSSVPHELFEYPSGGHNISGASFVSAMQKTVKWYQEN